MGLSIGSFVGALEQAATIFVAASLLACSATGIYSQTILGTNNLSSELVTSFAPSSPPPDPTGDLYNSVFEVTNQPAFFNNTPQPLRNVIIDGNVVVIDASIPGGYWSRYNGATDLANFTINASNVIFRSQLVLPGTMVTINCKNLDFETANGVLDVTPLAAQPAAAISANGANGQAAGNITLNIVEFTSDNTRTTRFIAKGGRGGDPGPGASGLDGQSLPDTAGSCNGSRGGTGEPNGADGMSNGHVVFIDYQQTGQKKANPVHEMYCGTQASPTSGQNAIPAGKPGNPGPAGIIASTVDVSLYADVSGGIAGTQGTNYAGGQAGTPSPAYWAIVQWNADGGPYWHRWATMVTTNGLPASSPPADVPFGTNGAVVILPASTTWVTSGYGRAALAFAQDAYRQEYYALTQSALSGLASDLAAATNSPEASALLAIEGQAQTLLHRLAVGNTYWNWPINYAPLLSLQVTEAAFKSAIENSLYPIYLDQVLHSANRNISDKLAAVQQAKQNLIADLATQSATISNTLVTIPVLQQEAVQNGQNILQLQTNLQIIAQLELQEAQTIVQNSQIQNQTPVWQTILRAGSALADFTPYGPAVTAVVNGAINVANDLNKIDSSSPWQTIAAVPDLTSALGTAFGTGPNSIFTVSSTLSKQIRDLTPTDNQNWSAYLTNIQALTAPLKTGVTNLSSLLASTPITSSQVQAVLNNIKATDPALSDTANKLNAALQRKQSLAQAAATAVQAISTAQDQIQADLLALDACSQQLDTGSLVLSYGLLKTMDTISARALDQIAWYQALMAAAYRYQWLQQYPGNFGLNDLIRQVQQFAATAPIALNPSDFAPIVSLYETDLTAVGNAIVDYYDNNFFPLQTHQIYDFDVNAIRQLNSSNGIVRLNLARAGLFPADEQNVRLVRIGFYNIGTSIPAGYKIDQIASLTITIQHSGLSTLAYNGTLYNFFHYADNAQNPVVWSAKVDLKHGTTNTATPSPILGSLVGNLVGLPNTSVQDIFASLGADSDLEISIQAFSNNNIPIQLTNLSLDVEYVYQELSRSSSIVEVIAQPGTSPEISVDTPDLEGRTNGLPPFLRSYNKNTTSSIRLAAPERFQNMTFQSWVDQFGNPVGSNTVITLALAGSQVVTPVYQQPMALFGLAFSNSTVVCWPTPADIDDGTPLGIHQLNAVANVPGTFAYTPTEGTILTGGLNTLSVVFTPSDSAHYDTLTNNVTLHVTYSTRPLIESSISNGSFSLRFTTAPGSVYIIQRATDINGPWTSGASVTVDSGGTGSYATNVITAPTAQFFRAVLN